MRVVLETDVRNVGAAGAVVDVADGFARNFLLPRRLARAATAGTLREAERIAARAAKRAEAETEAAREIAGRLAGTSLTFARKTAGDAAAGAEPRIFGSVTTAEIAEALAAQGIAIDRRKIALDEPIRALGRHEIPVRLNGGVEATVRVWIVAEGERAAASAPTATARA